MVGLLGDVPLGSEYFGLSSVNLLSCGCDLPLDIVVVTVLLVQEESRVVNFLADHMETHSVGIVPLFEIVVHQQLFVLQVAVLRLDGV